jgi:hypothetical protein
MDQGPPVGTITARDFRLMWSGADKPARPKRKAPAVNPWQVVADVLREERERGR